MGHKCKLPASDAAAIGSSNGGSSGQGKAEGTTLRAAKGLHGIPKPGTDSRNGDPYETLAGVGWCHSIQVARSHLDKGRPPAVAAGRIYSGISGQEVAGMRIVAPSPNGSRRATHLR